eukprot:m.72646 g.72646  ORF g.72646 m.72646 type:complete len:220 (+) comp14274_c0_seq4:114-773(+)
MELPPDVANLEHAATAALAAISSSPARSMTSPSSAAKRKARVRRLPESKAPHIMTSFDKDLNLAAITETTTLYQACRSWMHADTSGLLLAEEPNNGVSLGALHLPDPVGLTDEPVQHNTTSEEDRQVKNSQLDAALQAQDAAITPGPPASKETSATALQFVQLRQQWKALRQQRQHINNMQRAKQYQGSLKVIHEDRAVTPVATPRKLVQSLSRAATPR